MERRATVLTNGLSVVRRAKVEPLRGDDFRLGTFALLDRVFREHDGEPGFKMPVNVAISLWSAAS